METLDPAFATGKEFTVTVLLVVAVHPAALVTVTVYVVVDVGEIVMEVELLPVFQAYPVPPEAVNAVD